MKTKKKNKLGIISGARLRSTLRESIQCSNSVIKEKEKICKVNIEIAKEIFNQGQLSPTEEETRIVAFVFEKFKMAQKEREFTVMGFAQIANYLRNKEKIVDVAKIVSKAKTTKEAQRIFFNYHMGLLAGV